MCQKRDYHSYGLLDLGKGLKAWCNTCQNYKDQEVIGVQQHTGK